MPSAGSTIGKCRAVLAATSSGVSDGRTGTPAADTAPVARRQASATCSRPTVRRVGCARTPHEQRGSEHTPTRSASAASQPHGTRRRRPVSRRRCHRTVPLSEERPGGRGSRGRIWSPFGPVGRVVGGVSSPSSTLVGGGGGVLAGREPGVVLGVRVRHGPASARRRPSRCRRTRPRARRGRSCRAREYAPLALSDARGEPDGDPRRDAERAHHRGERGGELFAVADPVASGSSRSPCCRGRPAPRGCSRTRVWNQSCSASAASYGVWAPASPAARSSATTSGRSSAVSM